MIDPKLVVDSVLDKNYMIQLVEVQNRRGAVGGETFVKALEMQVPVIQDDEIKIALDTKKNIPQVTSKKLVQDKYVVLSETLNDVFYENPRVDVLTASRYLCKVQ